MRTTLRELRRILSEAIEPEVTEDLLEVMTEYVATSQFLRVPREENLRPFWS